MNGFVANNEIAIRLSIFFLVFIVLSWWEIRFPRRSLRIAKQQRWCHNWAISIFNAVFLKLTFPIMGVGMALMAQEKQWGLLNYLEFPMWVEVIIFVCIFDLVIYFQHRLFHLVTPLWRLHRVHHIDLDFDVTTGNRFHPVSIMLSMLIKLGLVLVIGPMAFAVILSEILLNATSMFNHSNIYIPSHFDRVLRYFIVTPDMHRVHHSTNKQEHNCNFGFNFPWWDRLFGTYQAQPVAGHEHMNIGIQGFYGDKAIKFYWLLVQPVLTPGQLKGDN
ncbi:MAG: sterol desaturase family protein [Pseudomonadales bacterium]